YVRLWHGSGSEATAPRACAETVRLRLFRDHRPDSFIKRLRNRNAVSFGSGARKVAALAGQSCALPRNAGEKILGGVFAAFSRRKGRLHEIGVEGNHEFTVAGRGPAALIESVRLTACPVADERPGKKLDHGRQRRSLVPAERQHRSSQNGGRIG